MMEMAGGKRKVGRETYNKNDKVRKNRRLTHTTNSKNGTKELKEVKVKKMTGPRLPAKLRDAIDMLNSKSTEGDVINGNDIEREDDVYEYEEEIPQEESKKNHRFDTVENYEYELPDNFEDEDVLSEDDEEDMQSFREESDEKIVEVKQGFGSTSDDYEGTIVGEKMESGEDDVLETDDLNTIDEDGGARVSFNDLLAPLQGNPGFSRLRKMIHQVEEKSAPIHAPLPKPEEDRVERKTAYRLSNNDITKWESRVKRNREAPTLYFDTKLSFPLPTVDIVASRFEPRTDFEKKMASIVHHEKIVQAFSEDGTRLLELNKVSVEDVKDRQNALAKMRSLLFQHEVKAKRVKKIKSKTYHRILKRQRQRNLTYVDSHLDPEAAKELAMKQEFKRAEERMTRRHKNTSRWVTRVLHRGLNIQDEGTRAAISEQLHQHAILTRKMNSMKEGSSSSSGESSDEGDGESSGSDRKKDSELLKRAKEKTLQAVEPEEDAAALKSGVLSLPFMVRGMKKRQMAAVEEAKLAVREYESSIQKLDGTETIERKAGKLVAGRRVFNPPMKDVRAGRVPNPTGENGSDSESGREGGTRCGSPEIRREAVVMENSGIDLRFLHEGSEAEEPVPEKLDDIVSCSPLRPKPKYGVSICGSGFDKRKKGDTVDVGAIGCFQEGKPALNVLELKEEKKEEEGEGDDDEGSGESDESDGDEVGMVEGMLTHVGEKEYELPSQGELIQRAFAGDDVEEQFRREKEEVVDEENPKPEEPVMMPGWGEWREVQEKRGMPSWMTRKHEAAKQKREEALKKRKDIHLNHVVISEKPDKKAEKLQSESTPYPYTSKEVFERSMRMPMGPDFNPATAVGDLHRPAVVKRPGVIINPIEFKHVNPHEEDDENKKKDKSMNKRKRLQKPKVFFEKRPTSCIS